MILSEYERKTIRNNSSKIIETAAHASGMRYEPGLMEAAAYRYNMGVDPATSPVTKYPISSEDAYPRKKRCNKKLLLLK